MPLGGAGGGNRPCPWGGGAFFNKMTGGKRRQSVWHPRRGEPFFYGRRAPPHPLSFAFGRGGGLFFNSGEASSRPLSPATRGFEPAGRAITMTDKSRNGRASPDFHAFAKSGISWPCDDHARCALATALMPRMTPTDVHGHRLRTQFQLPSPTFGTRIPIWGHQRCTRTRFEGSRRSRRVFPPIHAYDGLAWLLVQHSCSGPFLLFRLFHPSGSIRAVHARVLTPGASLGTFAAR